MATAANTKFKVENGLDVVGTANVSGALRVDGDFTVGGNFTSALNITGDFKPTADLTYNLGSAILRWGIIGGTANFSNTLTVSGDTSLNVVTTNALSPAANNTGLGSETRRWDFYGNNATLVATSVAANAALANVTISSALNMGTVSANLSHFVLVGSTSATFNALTGVANTTEIITTSTIHGFANNDQVVYTVSTGNTAVAGLVSGTTYFVLNAVAYGTTLQLSATSGGAVLGLTAGVSQIGHTLTRFGSTFSANTGSKLAILASGNATYSNLSLTNDVTAIAGNVAFDTDLLTLDATNNRIGLKTGISSLSTAALATITGNLEFSTVNTGIRLQTSNTSMNAAVMMTGNTTNTRVTFSTFDSGISGTTSGGFVFNGTNATATQTLLDLNSTSLQYKSGNVAHSGNFGIYNVSGTRVGP